MPLWDDRTFYDFVASSDAFSRLSFRHREVFGQVGFGTGGWDTDFPNSMLEILRVVMTNCEEDQRFMVGGVEQVPRGLWNRAPSRLVHWPQGTSLASLHGGAPRNAVVRIAREADGKLAVTDRWGHTRSFDAVLTTCQSWLLTIQIDCDESLFAPKTWMALDPEPAARSCGRGARCDRRSRAPPRGSSQSLPRGRPPRTGRRTCSARDRCRTPRDSARCPRPRARRE